MKNFMLGVLLLPAMVGATVMYHILFATKLGPTGEKLTNRLARAELVWLAMNKPKTFIEQFPQLAMDVEERHGIEDRALLHSGVFNPEYFLARHPEVVAEMISDPETVTRYWLTHPEDCRQSAPDFDPRTYMERYPELRTIYKGDCRLVAKHWVKWGKRAGLNATPDPQAVTRGKG